MDFTREPIIETVITPRDGYKVVVRSSKTVGQEEYFVDSVEVVSFGGASFFRSLERPKAFLVPVSDYEVLEVREARIVLKNVGLDRSIKIAGGKEGGAKPHPVKEDRHDRGREDRSRESREDRREEKAKDDRSSNERSREDKTREDKTREDRPKENGSDSDSPRESQEMRAPEGRGRRDRRRGRGRRRQEGDDTRSEEGSTESADSQEKVDLVPPRAQGERVGSEERVSNSLMSELLTPPLTLISDTLDHYRKNALFQGAFYTKEELDQAGPISSPEGLHNSSLDQMVAQESVLEALSKAPVLKERLDEPAYESFEVSLKDEAHADESGSYPEFTDFEPSKTEESPSDSHS